jgi:hypothetical protein
VPQREQFTSVVKDGAYGAPVGTAWREVSHIHHGVARPCHGRGAERARCAPVRTTAGLIVVSIPTADI